MGLDYIEIFAKSLMQYNQSKIVAIQKKESDIGKYCDQKIVYYCNGLNKGGRIESVSEKLEEMKKSQPEFAEAISVSIRDLNAELYASQMTALGQEQVEARTDEQWEEASSIITENAEFIPSELVSHVKHNLTVKSEMPDFAHDHHAIANAILAININRFEDLNTSATSQSTEMTE